MGSTVGGIGEPSLITPWSWSAAAQPRHRRHRRQRLRIIRADRHLFCEGRSRRTTRLIAPRAASIGADPNIPDPPFSLKPLLRGCAADRCRQPRRRWRTRVRSLRLASVTGRPIFPVALATSHRIVLDSWDRSAVNLPFSRGIIVVGDPIRVPAEAGPEILEQARTVLEHALNANAVLDVISAPVIARTPHCSDAKPLGGDGAFKSMMEALADGWNMALTADVPKVSHVVDLAVDMTRDQNLERKSLAQKRQHEMLTVPHR